MVYSWMNNPPDVNSPDLAAILAFLTAQAKAAQFTLPQPTLIQDGFSNVGGTVVEYAFQWTGQSLPLNIDVCILMNPSGASIALDQLKEYYHFGDPNVLVPYTPPEPATPPPPPVPVPSNPIGPYSYTNSRGQKVFETVAGDPRGNGARWEDPTGIYVKNVVASVVGTSASWIKVG